MEPRSDTSDQPLVELTYVTAGVLMTALCGGGYVAYCLMTWTHPHRVWSLALGLSAFAFAGVYLTPQVQRGLRGPRAGDLWLLWSVGLILATSTATWLDGSAHSPVLTLFAVPLMFAALCYPPRLAAIVCVAEVAGASISLGVSHAGLAYTQLVVTVLLAAAGMCLWHSRRQARQNDRLDALSRTDYLTGCLNRRGFEEALGSFLGRQRRSNHAFALAIFDLDGFKAINDHDGHAAGDLLLQWTATTLTAQLRGGDVLARLGGDEFAVLLSDPGQDGDAALQRFVAAVTARTPISGGLAICPADGADPEELYRVADRRLYAAKRASFRV